MNVMKKISVTLLIILVSAVFSPLTISISPDDGASFLVTLDVCNFSGSSVSVNADSPIIQECPCALCPSGLSGSVEIVHFLYRPSLFASREDRPPQS
jgi:hypothetical protein